LIFVAMASACLLAGVSAANARVDVSPTQTSNAMDDGCRSCGEEIPQFSPLPIK
jgi:hypothetical protein